MARGEKHQPEQVVNLLRQIGAAVANESRPIKPIGRRALSSKPTIDGAGSDFAPQVRAYCDSAGGR
jgi:hypothetical protein